MQRELDECTVIDVSGWQVVGPEPRGKRAKTWLRDPSRRLWLRKEALTSPPRPTEPVVESTVLRLARAAGIDAPESYLCVWKDGAETRRGIIVRSFIQEKSVRDFADGAAVLKGVIADYDPEEKAGHTIGRIKKALGNFERRYSTPRALRTEFQKLILFDAWVGNGDRHPGNWGILRAPNQFRLAPIYDVAACLGVELPDDAPLLDPLRRTDELLARYARACPSGFGDGQRLIGQADVLKEIRRWDGWKENAERFLPIFADLWDGPLWRYLRTVPRNWLDERRRIMILELLAHRLGWLRRAV